mmetsp:Transcript_2232/g.4796  ORF Transcript_2232/g.4796 Transcript_2232/m.4796 type:complete len:201 (+) Transcript_2232:357-959(+)
MRSSPGGGTTSSGGTEAEGTTAQTEMWRAGFERASGKPHGRISTPVTRSCRPGRFICSPPTWTPTPTTTSGPAKSTSATATSSSGSAPRASGTGAAVPRPSGGPPSGTNFSWTRTPCWRPVVAASAPATSAPATSATTPPPRRRRAAVPVLDGRRAPRNATTHASFVTCPRRAIQRAGGRRRGRTGPSADTALRWRGPPS